MDRFRTMESFVRVVRAGSFTIAAGQLGLSRALVSRHISELEARLGVRLLHRSTRSLSLTDEGAAYLAFCERVFRDIESNERAIVRTRLEPAGTLNVLAPKSFGTLHLSDAVIAFAKAQPRLRLSLRLENTPYRGVYNFAERGLDLVLCFSPMRSASVVAQEIATFDWVLCAAPDYLARAGRLATPADLAEHACLVHVDVMPNDSIWRFEGPKGPVAAKVRGAFSSNSAAALRKAAVAGLGVTLVPRYVVAEDLADGALVSVLPRYRVGARPFMAVYQRAPVAPNFTAIAHLFDRIVERLPEALVFDDNIILAQTYLKASPQHRYFPNSGVSALGHAIPAAIGARCAVDTPTFAILGDGGFQMCCMELMTAVNYRIPLNVVMINNGTLGLIRKNQFQLYRERYIDCDFVNPDFALLAQSFGIRHFRIETAADVDALFDTADLTGDINLIEVMWDKHVFPTYRSDR
jgi:DNA-binding transcriptional LysR family regulator